MQLEKDRAIALILALSQNKEIWGLTKLNKLLARLNLHCISLDINFFLNKFGSYNKALEELEDTSLYAVKTMDYKGKDVKKFILKPLGEKLYAEIIKELILTLPEDDVQKLKSEINALSKLTYEQISRDEHQKLLVDADDREKLKQRINEVVINFLDLQDKLNKIPEDTFSHIKLKALIEYCFQLSKYLKDKRFARLEENYEYEGRMSDYYFLYILHTMIPIIEKQISTEQMNEKEINKYYEYIISNVDENYPFSVNNPELLRLI